MPPRLFEASIAWDRNPDAPGNGLGVSGLLFTKEVLPAATLKDIGYDYAVYRFATRPQLNQLWRRALREDLIKPVLAAFRRELAEALSGTRGAAGGDEYADQSGK